jgi:hypothetical protein
VRWRRCRRDPDLMNDRSPNADVPLVVDLDGTLLRTDQPA